MGSEGTGGKPDKKRRLLRKLPPAGSRAGKSTGRKKSKTPKVGLFRPRKISSDEEGRHAQPDMENVRTAEKSPREPIGRQGPETSALRPEEVQAYEKKHHLRRPDGRSVEPQKPRQQKRPTPVNPQRTKPKPRSAPRSAQQHQRGRSRQAPPQRAPYAGRRSSPRPPGGLKAAPRQEMREEALRHKAQPYDWGKTEKFSQDQKKFLERIFKQFSDYLTTKLAPLLQAKVEIDYQGIKLRPYSTFLQGLYEPISIILIRIDPQFKGLTVLDFPLSFTLIDKCLGGRGQPIEEVRYFTDIEVAVLERIVMRVIESYQDAWSEIKEIKPQYLEMQFNPQTVHIIKPSDTVAFVSFDMKVAQASGPMYVVLPFEYLKTILPKANFEEFMLTRTSTTQVSPSVAPLFAKNLEQARVPVSVELGSTELLFSELSVLEVGDFVKLDQEITKALRIKVNDRFKFLGRPGVKDAKMAVQITKVLQEGDEDLEE